MMPLVSFIVKCYNQVRYIGEAMDGALAQTYRPLEIVIADDASTDGSVAVIRKKLAAAGFTSPSTSTYSSPSPSTSPSTSTYSSPSPSPLIERYGSGDCTVTLILNRRNLGNCGNWQMACSVAKGELFVKADGDDVSLPERTARVIAQWQKAGPHCGVIYHNAVKIDEEGREIGDVTKEVFQRHLPQGAVMACSRKCFEHFGEIADGCAADDTVYATRAEFLGLTAHRFDEKLVRYRIGCGISTVGASYCDSLHGSVIRATRTAACKIADWQSIRSKVPPADYEKNLACFQTARQRLLAELPMWEADRFPARWRSFRATHPRLTFNRVFLVHALLLLPRRLARFILDAIYKSF